MSEPWTLGPWRTEGTYPSFVSRKGRREGGLIIFDGEPKEGGGCTVRYGECGTICSMTWNEDNREEVDANARLIAAAPEMAQELQFVRGLLAHNGAESGYCMCGDPIESHNMGSGHSPVDSHSYTAGQAVERIDALLAKIGGAA